jgi:gluconokinase
MIVIVMGVTGSGKTTVGQMLAQQMGWEFADADSFHSEKNIEKMRQGIALDDEDRAPWLASLRTAIVNWIAQKKSVVLACSALKKRYRAELQVGAEVKFVYLKGSRELIEERLRARHGHFAGDSILAGQFADLEEPEGAIVVDVASSPERIVGEIRDGLGCRYKP